jgi:hypothetical protein
MGDAAERIARFWQRSCFESLRVLLRVTLRGMERLYSIIYDAINEVRDAMEGMLALEVEEVIVGNAEVCEVFKISKVGAIAGCMVTDTRTLLVFPLRFSASSAVMSLKAYPRSQTPMSLAPLTSFLLRVSEICLAYNPPSFRELV